SLSSLVAEEKSKTGKAVFDPQREKEIINKLTENLDDEMSEYVTELYNSIFEMSKKRQNKIISKE
ncbi:MAG: chorismate mutase, partial [Christensenellaceae bacterium]|nr:chorismate mutase [Christensenellaceae bacterium]